MALRLHNTLTRSIEDFKPIFEEKVSLYTCGPTVYDYLHVGNWAAYIYWDTLVRVLTGNGYTVERVMNITDVGHLVSDADEGEDKLEKGAKREGKTAWQVAEFYTNDFLEGMSELNLIKPQHITKATDFITEQLDLVRVLKQKGHTYQIYDGIYFDTSTFPSYADFAQLDLQAQEAGARVEFNKEKRNPSDFALWKFSPVNEHRDMEWPTPVDLLDGSSSQTSIMGFPGWHLECSAMAMSILGDTIDIHTGGIDHIPVHHTNEIAQSEAASGKQFANWWLHNNHLKVNGTKISKSLKNGYTLHQLKEKGFSPLDYRMAVLQGHYRSEANFTLESLEAARNRRQHWRDVACLRWQISNKDEEDETLINNIRTDIEEISDALCDDLNTPHALMVADRMFSTIERQYLNGITTKSMFVTAVYALDKFFGLDLVASTPKASEEVKQLFIQRLEARKAKDWELSDRLRNDLLDLGVQVKDTANGGILSYL